MPIAMLETWHEDGSRVWHLGWVDAGYQARAECIGGCEHWHQIAEEMPAQARVCAKARKALGTLLGSRYEIVGVTEVRTPTPEPDARRG
mgnify:CR=1 FL=1